MLTYYISNMTALCEKQAEKVIIRPLQRAVNHGNRIIEYRKLDQPLMETFSPLKKVIGFE